MQRTNASKKSNIEKKVIFSVALVVVALVLVNVVSSFLTAQSDLLNIAAVVIVLIGGFAMYKGFQKVIALSILLMLSFVSSGCYERIDAGHVGIKVNLYGADKGVQDVTLVTGAVWYNPWTHNVFEFPIYTQTKDYEPFVVVAKGGGNFTVDPSLNYFAVAEKVPGIYKQYRKDLEDLEDGAIRNMVFDAYKNTANEFTSDSLMFERAKFENRVQERLSADMELVGFKYERLTSGITPPQSLQDAIDAKNKAIQDAMRVENEIQKEKAQAEIAITKADGIAKAKLIDARAEAEAFRMKQQTITPLLIQQQMIEKWDGKLPVYGTIPAIFKTVTEK